MIHINQLIDFWITTHWMVALLMSIGVNIIVYVVTAYTLEKLIKHAVNTKNLGSYTDTRDFKPFQKLKEIKYGITACIIFSIGSLFSRLLFDSLWPKSLAELGLQVASFILFYETYSYFVHRLLHTTLFSKYHSVHHSSIRVTPWSAYSMHPLEATFIGFSAPIFMCIFPLSLGVALVLHIFGMMFTILLHSNYEYTPPIKWARPLFKHASYHSKHHFYGNVNFGFVNGLWDSILKTKHNG